MFQNRSRGKTVDKVRNVECKKKERLIWIPAPSLDNPCGLNYCGLGMTPIISDEGCHKVSLNGCIVGQLHLMSKTGGSFQNILLVLFAIFLGVLHQRWSHDFRNRLRK